MKTEGCLWPLATVYREWVQHRLDVRNVWAWWALHGRSRKISVEWWCLDFLSYKQALSSTEISGSLPSARLPSGHRKGGRVGPSEMDEAGKDVSPSPSPLCVPRHSWPPVPPSLPPRMGHLPPTLLSHLQPAFSFSGQPPIPCSLTLSFTYSIIPADVLWFLKLPLSQ